MPGQKGNQQVDLSDRQHEELLQFAEQTLQDIRDAKAAQQQALLGFITAVAGLVAVSERLALTGFQKIAFCALLAFTGLLGFGYILRQQREILDFRKRIQAIYNDHFTLDWQPIIGRAKTHDSPRAFSLLSDLVPLSIVLLAAAVLISCIWILSGT